MRTFLLSLILFLALAMPTMAQMVNGGTALIIGARYDESVRGAYGLARNVGGPLWITSTVDWGQPETYWHNEIMAVTKAPGLQNMYLGVVAGPTATWTHPNEENPNFLTYLQGSVGGVAVYNMSVSFSAGGYVKYVASLEDNSLSERWIGGVAILLKI